MPSSLCAAQNLPTGTTITTIDKKKKHVRKKKRCKNKQEKINKTYITCIPRIESPESVTSATARPCLTQHNKAVPHGSEGIYIPKARKARERLGSRTTITFVGCGALG